MKKSYRNKIKKESILRHLTNRSLGICNSKPSSIENLEKHLPFFWKKKVLETEKHNKIFASQWINNETVVYGTKCNKLYCLNVNKSTSYEIPLIEGVSRTDQRNAHSTEPSTNFGIHAIKKNYNDTLLATGALNVNSVGIYKMSELRPMSLLENFHSDAIFDICWLDDSYLATCSRDSKMGIWCVNSNIIRPDHYYFNRSKSINDCYDVEENMIGAYYNPINQLCLDYNANRFRAMEYLQSTNRLLIATMSNRLYSVDPSQNMDEVNQIQSFKTAIQEMVAIRRWPVEPHSFAVGGQARFAIYDSRKQGEAMNVLALNQSAGIRSLAFKDYVISYGTAEGHINFFDLRAKKHLDSDFYIQSRPYDDFSITNFSSPLSSTNFVQLRMEGVFEQNDIIMGARGQTHNQTAIYTHEYDPTKSKMFAGGGPIAACHSGQAASLFE